MLPLIEAGARGAETLEDAVKEAKIIITCLLDDQAVLETTQSFVHYQSPHTIHIGTSTILPETSKSYLIFTRKTAVLILQLTFWAFPKQLHEVNSLQLLQDQRM